MSHAPPTPPDPPYVSRGGLKLRAALEAFALDVRGLTCADLGCSTGGFTDCLLRAGASRVIAVDTAYGEFAWRLRNDPRVRLMERTNALHTQPPEAVDLVVIDLGWTRQRLALPVARRWLRAGDAARVISLIKPHYEIDKAELKREGVKGVLPEEVARAVFDRTCAAIPELGFRLLGQVRSPIAGGAGNAEWLVLLAPADPAAAPTAESAQGSPGLP